MYCCMQHITAKRNAWAIAPQNTMTVNNGTGAASLYAPESFAGSPRSQGTTKG